MKFKEIFVMPRYSSRKSSSDSVNNSKRLMILTLFLGLGFFSNGLFGVLSVDVLNQKKNRVINIPSKNQSVLNVFISAYNLAKRAFDQGQNNNNIKVAGLNLFATMIENLEKVPEDALVDRNLNLRNTIIFQSRLKAKNSFGVSLNDNYSLLLKSDDDDVRIAAINVLMVLKHNIGFFSNFVQSIILKEASFVVAAVFALPFRDDDNIADRVEDESVYCKVKALELMTFINNNFDRITGNNVGNFKQQIMDNTQAIIEKSKSGGEFWNSAPAKERIAFLLASSLKNIKDNEADNYISEIVENLVGSLKNISNLDQVRDLDNQQKELFKTNVFKAIIPQEDTDNAKEFSEKVAAEFVQKVYKELSGGRNFIQFKNVFENLKESLKYGFRDGAVGGIDYVNMPLNKSYTKFSGSTLERLVFIIKLFDRGKLTDKGLKSAIGQLISEWKNKGILQKK